MEEEKNQGKNVGASFGDMVKEFGEAVSKIFNDPELKKKAKEFGESATESAKAFGERFKDEEVKAKFREVGNAAKKFGESVSETFKEDKNSYSQDKKTEKKNLEPEASRGSRLAGYSVSIAWNIIFLIFFNFFYQYVAFYHFDSGTQMWARYPVLTDDFVMWLPIFTVSVAVSIAGNILMIILDHYYVRKIVNIIMNIFGIAAIGTLLSIFPFDFSGIPVANMGNILYPLVMVVLIIILVGLAISVIVNLVKLIVFMVKKEI